jgi:hypothetical protein
MISKESLDQNRERDPKEEAEVAVVATEVEEVAAVATEVAVVASEEAEAREPKAKKAKEEVDTAEEVDSEAAEARELKAKKVKPYSEVVEAVAEVAVEVHPLMAKVTKVLPCTFPRKELISLAKMNISKARETKSGTHMTEDLALVEAEKSPRVVMESSTSVPTKTSSSKVMMFPRDLP